MNDIMVRYRATYTYVRRISFSARHIYNSNDRVMYIIGGLKITLDGRRRGRGRRWCSQPSKKMGSCARVRAFDTRIYKYISSRMLANNCTYYRQVKTQNIGRSIVKCEYVLSSTFGRYVTRYRGGVGRGADNFKFI